MAHQDDPVFKDVLEQDDEQETNDEKGVTDCRNFGKKIGQAVLDKLNN